MTGWKWALELVTHNFLWKLVALAGAVLIWALVTNEPELSTFATVRLEFRNLPAELEISSQPAETVTLELRGPASELRGQGDSRRPAVVLDMSGAAPGQRTFQIGNGNISLPRGVSLVRSVPSQVRFEFERRAVRDIPVQTHFTGEGANGWVVAKYTVTPAKLPVEGPVNHVTRLQAATTDPVDVSSATATAQLRVNAFLTDSYVRFEGSPEVVVTVTMKKQAR
jgi:YbbR domain-containing protein